MYVDTRSSEQIHEHKNNDEFKPVTFGITLSATETVKKGQLNV